MQLFGSHLGGQTSSSPNPSAKASEIWTETLDSKRETLEVKGGQGSQQSYETMEVKAKTANRDVELWKSTGGGTVEVVTTRSPYEGHRIVP